MYKQYTFIFLTVDQFFKMYITIYLQYCAHLILFFDRMYRSINKYIHVQNHDIFCKHQRNFKGTLFSINVTYTEYTEQIYLNYFIEYTCLISNNRVSHIKSLQIVYLFPSERTHSLEKSLKHKNMQVFETFEIKNRPLRPSV